MNFWLTILLALQLFTATVLAAPKITNTTYCLAGVRAYIDGSYVCNLNSSDTSQTCNACNSEIALLSVLKCVSDIDTAKALKKAPKAIVTSCRNKDKLEEITSLIDQIDNYSYMNLSVSKLESLKVITEPFLVPKKYIKSVKKEIKVYREGSTEDHIHVGTAIPAFWLFVFVLRTITNLTYTYFHRLVRALDVGPVRKFRKFVLLPPTFKYTHSSVLKKGFFSYSIPVRHQTLIIIAYSIVHFIIYFVHYRCVDDAIYGASLIRQVSTKAAARSGFFILYQIPLLVLFAGRNNFLLWLTDWPIDAFNVFHRWVGRWIMLDLVFHFVTYSILSANRNVLGARWGRTYWKWGFVSFMMGLPIVILGSHCVRAWKYEIFLVTHCVLAFFFFLGAYYHIDYLESELQFVYATFAVWAFDRLFRVLRILYSGVNSKAESQLFPDGIIKVKLSYSKLWKYRPGSYIFVTFLHKKNFWQSHPFTLIDSPLEEDKGKVVILMKVKKGMTKQIQESLLQKPDGKHTFGALIDGPYGHDKNLSHYENVVMVAGGIGITGVYSYASTLRKTTDQSKRFLFIWCITSDSSLQWFKDELEYLVADSRFDVRVFIREDQEGETTNTKVLETSSIVSSQISSHETEPSGSETSDITEKKETTYDGLAGEKIYRRSTRYDVKEAIRDEMLNASNSTAVICCGPGAMNDDVRVTIAKHLETAQGLVDYYEEAFSW